MPKHYHTCLLMNALLALRPCLVSHQCRCVLQRLSVADFKRPCLKPLGVHFRHPCLACSSRCTEYCHSHNNCKKTIIPRKSPTPLPPLSKGGGLTAKRKPLYCCFLLVPRPPFLFTKPFCRQDGGIASPPRFAPHFLPPLVKGEVLSPKKFGRLPEGLPHQPFQKPHYPSRFS